MATPNRALEVVADLQVNSPAAHFALSANGQDLWLETPSYAPGRKALGPLATRRTALRIIEALRRTELRLHITRDGIPVITVGAVDGSLLSRLLGLPHVSITSWRGLGLLAKAALT